MPGSEGLPGAGFGGSDLGLGVSFGFAASLFVSFFGNPGPRSWQLPPAQVALQVAFAAQVFLQLPPSQVTLQVEPGTQLVWHLPPVHVRLQVEFASQCSLQSPPGQSSEQVVPLAHFMSHLPPAHDSLQLPVAHASLHLPSAQPLPVVAPVAPVAAVPLVPAPAPVVPVPVVGVPVPLAVVPVELPVGVPVPAPVPAPEPVTAPDAEPVASAPAVLCPLADEEELPDGSDDEGDSGGAPSFTVHAALPMNATTRHRAVVVFMPRVVRRSRLSRKRLDGVGRPA